MLSVWPKRHTMIANSYSANNKHKNILDSSDISVLNLSRLFHQRTVSKLRWHSQKKHSARDRGKTIKMQKERGGVWSEGRSTESCALFLPKRVPSAPHLAS